MNSKLGRKHTKAPLAAPLSPFVRLTVPTGTQPMMWMMWWVKVLIVYIYICGRRRERKSQNNGLLAGALFFSPPLVSHFAQNTTFASLSSYKAPVMQAIRHQPSAIRRPHPPSVSSFFRLPLKYCIQAIKSRVKFLAFWIWCLFEDSRAAFQWSSKYYYKF